MTYYSGCNYYINQGKVPEEPFGTAQSMHDCDCCERLEYCKLKKETETWEFNEDIKEQMKKDWYEMEKV